MKRTIVVVVLCGMFGWAIFDFVYQSDKNSETYQSTEDIEVVSHDGELNAPVQEVGLNTGELAPDFTVKTLEEQEVTLSDYRGQRVMLNFWATWCPPCRAEMPAMQKFFEENDVVVLALNLIETESSLQDVMNFVDEYNLTFPVLLDYQNKVSTAYQIQPIPTSFMIDSNGVIQHKSYGALNQEQMQQALRTME